MTEPPSDPVTPDRPSRLRMNLVLYLVTLLTAAACVVVGVKVYRAAQEEPVPELPASGGLPVSDLAEAPEDEQQRFADVMDSANGLATAFINIRHDDLDASIAAVSERSTGSFRKQFSSSEESLRKLMRQSRAVQEGEVLWTAVESVDDDSARVLVATTGTVANKSTDGNETARNYRLLLELVETDGEWLTNSLEFIS